MKCKKLVYKTGNPEPYDKEFLYGRIISETEEFLIFQTARRIYRVSKSMILILEDTNREFQEQSQADYKCGRKENEK